MKSRTVHVLASITLVVAGFVGLVVAVEIALKTDGDSSWLFWLVVPPTAAWIVLVVVGVLFKRATRRSIVHDAAGVLRQRDIEELLRRIRDAEAWLGRLWLEDLEDELRRRVDRREHAV